MPPATLANRAGRAQIPSIMRPIILALVLLVLLVACRAEPALPPEQVVERFYTTYMAAGVSGAPSEAELEALAPFLSDTLEALLRSARRLRDAEAAASPEEKPAFAEGDLFSSLFEGPTAVVVESRDITSSPRRYAARLTHQAADGPFTWTDLVLVSEEGRRWVISDIEYGGTWDFATRGTLRKGLEEALADQ